MKYICVFCGSSEKGAAKYAEEVKLLAKAMVQNGYGLVFGGANTGLMKLIADAVLNEGGEVIGVDTPEVKGLRVDYPNIKMYEEANFADRKAKMTALSAGFIALPGGIGTFDELFTVSLHNQFAGFTKEVLKPCAVFNINGFYDGLMTQLKRSQEEHFITDKHLKSVHFSDDPFDLLHFINEFQPDADVSRWWQTGVPLFSNREQNQPEKISNQTLRFDN